VGVTLVIHITAGALGLVLGYIALGATKGGPVHRKAGMLFVFAMVTMAIIGMLMSAVQGIWVPVNVPAGWTTAYLVTTSLATIRRPDGWSRRLDVALMILALGVGALMITFGLEAVAAGGKRGEIPAFPFFLFGVVGLIAAAGDVRILRSGALTGSSRLKRHLWRMSFALFIAAMSFFIGQSDEFPKALRVYPLLAVPVLIPLVSMVYWLWRQRVTRIGLARTSGRSQIGIRADAPSLNGLVQEGTQAS
jgi:uncharacterized membrane protein